MLASVTLASRLAFAPCSAACDKAPAATTEVGLDALPVEAGAEAGAQPVQLNSALDRSARRADGLRPRCLAHRLVVLSQAE